MKRRGGREYGFAIVDRHGEPWWDEACVCQDRGPMDDTVETLNDSADYEGDDERAPYRVVQLLYVEAP